MSIFLDVIITLLPIALWIATLGLMIWALVDLRRRQSVANKPFWVIFIILFPLAGSVVYLIRSRKGSL